MSSAIVRDLYCSILVVWRGLPPSSLGLGSKQGVSSKWGVKPGGGRVSALGGVIFQSLPGALPLSNRLPIGSPPPPRPRTVLHRSKRGLRSHRGRSTNGPRSPGRGRRRARHVPSCPYPSTSWCGHDRDRADAAHPHPRPPLRCTKIPRRISGARQGTIAEMPPWQYEDFPPKIPAGCVEDRWGWESGPLRGKAGSIDVSSNEPTCASLAHRWRRTRHFHVLQAHEAYSTRKGSGRGT